MGGPNGASRGAWLPAVGGGVAAGALLVAAGVALRRRMPGRVRVARSTALACGAAVAGVQLTSPWMSIASSLLGVVAPLALLLVAGRTRGPSLPAVA